MLRTDGAFGFVLLAFAILVASLVGACAAPESDAGLLPHRSTAKQSGDKASSSSSSSTGSGSSSDGTPTGSSGNGSNNTLAGPTADAPAKPSVLQRLTACLDKSKFDAIKFETLVTTARTETNNPGKQVEDADTCTGCNAVQCSSCHSADPATGFMMAIGNDVLPPDWTFNEMQTTTPPYMQKYFGLDTDVMPVASNVIKAKSDQTVKTGIAYQHPMFILAPELEAQINDFVQDAITKFRNGACGK